MGLDRKANWSILIEVNGNTRFLLAVSGLQVTDRVSMDTKGRCTASVTHHLFEYDFLQDKDT